MLRSRRRRCVNGSNGRSRNRPCERCCAGSRTRATSRTRSPGRPTVIQRVGRAGRAVAPRGRVAAKAVQRIVDWFCNGSVEEVLVGMVDASMLDQRQLRLLADKVAKAKGGKK